MENVKLKCEEGKKKPVRMCVVCRKKILQDELNRLQCNDGKIVKWRGVGRSFYICGSCIKNKQFIKYISKMCKISKEEAKSQILHFPFYIVN